MDLMAGGEKHMYEDGLNSSCYIVRITLYDVV